MTDQKQTVRTEELFGVAKKMTLELENLPLRSHATVLAMMNASMQHRQLQMNEQAEAAREEQVRIAQERARTAQQKQALADAGIVLAQ